MGVQFMQSEGLYSQLFHFGQNESRHNWKHGGGGGEGGGGGAGGGLGYYKSLLEGDQEASICSAPFGGVNAEDSKPLLMRSLEIKRAHHSIPHDMGCNANKLLTINPLQITNSANHAANPTHIANHTTNPAPSGGGIEPNPSTTTTATVVSPLKRARDPTGHSERSGCAAVKREKKEGREQQQPPPQQQKGKRGGATAVPRQIQAAEAAAASVLSVAGGGGRKPAGSVKAAKPAAVAAAAAAAPAASTEPPRTDYVHVRARRGQATDSHSLAERVRREKISERMKFLQDLVPGCSKITGKALILDEIINYVQSLQNQVEFLAMRLAAANPKIEYASLSDSTDEEIASPFVDEVRGCIDMLPKITTTHTPTSDLQFDTLPTFYSSLFDESNFNSSMVSDLSTSTCNDSNLTNMDFAQIG